MDSATTPAACPSSPQRKSSMSASATENPRQPSASHESTPAQSKEDETKIEDKENRDRFEYEIRTFVEETRRSVSLYPEVEGQSFHLYKLARAVVTQKVANEQVDWRRVAEDLGYELKQNQGVANGLKKCFEKNLAVFFEASRILQAKLYERECSPAQSEEDGNESEADDEDHFYQDLEDFQDRSGLPVKRESEWTGGVLSVAGDLEAKYDWRQDQEVVDELKECFKENLAALFEEVLDDLEKEEAAQEHEEDEFQSNLHSLERQLYPSSPPVGPSGHCRNHDDDDDDPVYLPEKSTKRRRLDRTAEMIDPISTGINARHTKLVYAHWVKFHCTESRDGINCSLSALRTQSVKQSQPHRAAAAGLHCPDDSELVILTDLKSQACHKRRSWT
ncbi:hypothetical protein E4U36_008044 [Claviceps purpurea]|nr:hypothetical protein E4U36_008044 [Claviceps purpurea]